MVFAQGTSQEQQLISLINQKRVRLGLSPLRVDTALRQASALRARQVDIGEEIIPRTSSSTLMYTRLLEQGTHIVDVPARGDLVFYKDFDKPGTFAHVGIMLGSRDTALMEDG